MCVSCCSCILSFFYSSFFSWYAWLKTFMRKCGHKLDSRHFPQVIFLLPPPQRSALLSKAQQLQPHMKFGHQEPLRGPSIVRPPWKSQRWLPAGVTISNDNEWGCRAHVYSFIRHTLVAKGKKKTHTQTHRNVKRSSASTVADLDLDALAPRGTRPREFLAATPYQTCRHGHHDKGMQSR